MNKKLYFIIYCLGLAGLMLSLLPNQALAATDQAGITLTWGQQQFAVPKEQLTSWQGQQIIFARNILQPPTPDFYQTLFSAVGQAGGQSSVETVYHYQLQPIYNFVSQLALTLDNQTQEPVFELQNGRVINFTPAQSGKEVDAYQTSLNALQALETGATSLALVVYQTQPQTSLSQTNSLGVNELIGEGVSNFKGSPKNRIWNIKVGVEKMKGLIVPPGATFSFDDSLGPVDGEHGFLPELVIKKDNTVPEFGGGLCQVSTTTFRAAMAAGLPITARRNHAYAVSYYSPQGTDATIYPGSADLKFVNDTPGVILIWPYIKPDNKTLVFDFYGTNDGRQVTLEKPAVYDRQPDGSMKATWTRLVAKDGVTRTDVFNSVYQSPALFHKTESFGPSASSTTPNVQTPKTN